jgi:hypothetical protein
MAVPSFMAVSPLNWPMLARPSRDSWNRNPSIGKACPPPLLRSSGISFLHPNPRPDAGKAGQGVGRRAGPLSGVDPTVAYDRHQTEKAGFHQVFGFRLQLASALLVELVADDANIVSSQLPPLLLDDGWQVGSLHGMPIGQPSESWQNRK